MTESKMKTKSKDGSINIILVVLLIVAAFAIGSMWTQLKNQGSNTPTQPAKVAAEVTNAPAPTGSKVIDVDPVTADDHIQGKADAKVVLVEYSDYQCPFCKRFHPTMLKVMDKYGGDVAWVYRHYPLDQLHPDARAKAEASECIAAQGGNDAFWAFTDALFKDEVAVDKLGDLANKLGYDGAALKTCLDAGTYADKVESQLQSGKKAGISGTPGTIIIAPDGSTQLIPGALPLEQVTNMIDTALGN